MIAYLRCFANLKLTTLILYPIYEQRYSSELYGLRTM